MKKMHNLTSQQIIDHFNLLPHPEGGFYKEYYRSEDLLLASQLPERYSSERAFSTAIYYLLDRGARSKLHRLKTDEIWHFYSGDPLIIFEIQSNGRMVEHLLGQNILEGQSYQTVISAGSWFGAILAPESNYSLVSCTMAPGFDFVELEFADGAQLIQEFPEAKHWIEKLT